MDLSEGLIAAKLVSRVASKFERKFTTVALVDFFWRNDAVDWNTEAFVEVGRQMTNQILKDKKFD